ncbi:MAG: hypothetical protein HPY79_06235 [Bacteroidales bacterium]|nr:hypothetical protein [Bacteroidales bacterium]
MAEYKSKIDKNIIVTTFGGTWLILPEIIGFCCDNVTIFCKNDIYDSFIQTLKNNNVTTIDELWVICTHGETSNKAIENFNLWYKQVSEKGINIPECKFIGLKDISDLTTEAVCKQMADFIFRVVLKAYEEKRNGKLLLSLAGGRKTMSSDMQRAAFFFGCDILFHIADSGSPLGAEPNKLLDTLNEKMANAVFPVIIQEKIPTSPLTEIPTKLISSDYPIEFNRENIASTILLDEINNRLINAQSISFNAYKLRTSDFKMSIFQGLHQLNPIILNQLNTEKPDIEWINKLPKTDLHCHFGGILDIQGLIKVAKANENKILEALSQNIQFKQWYNSIYHLVEQANIDELKKILNHKDYLRQEIPEKYNLPRPLPLASFIICFKKKTDLLEKIIFGEYQQSNKYRNIGIESYERLGDLQGSGLLQSKESIVEACHYLIDYCKQHNIKYLELRCSPVNYTMGGLKEDEIVLILHNEFEKCRNIVDIRLIIIGSRHGDANVFRRHVTLTQNFLRDVRYKNFIVGFDVAGNEAKKSPKQLREELLPLMKECVRFTIHAGENQPVENIWEAVYELNADRIGHGLTLLKNKELLDRFRDKNIFIELCPSSNYQICDFENNEYPLKKYFEEGLKITINTDNPGISRTNITNEYYFASKIADLNKIQIIQLIRNSIQGTFLPKNEKKKLILQFEEEIYKILTNE